jgi:hypothetical protein
MVTLLLFFLNSGGFESALFIDAYVVNLTNNVRKSPFRWLFT